MNQKMKANDQKVAHDLGEPKRARIFVGLQRSGKALLQLYAKHFERAQEMDVVEVDRGYFDAQVQDD